MIVSGVGIQIHVFQIIRSELLSYGNALKLRSESVF